VRNADEGSGEEAIESFDLTFRPGFFPSDSVYNPFNGFYSIFHSIYLSFYARKDYENFTFHTFAPLNASRTNRDRR
jgi:hypothetical protein